MKKTIEMELEYLNILERPPESPQQLHRQAASNDDPTIEAWRDIWIRNQAANHATHGPFSENGIGELFGDFRNQPCAFSVSRGGP